MCHRSVLIAFCSAVALLFSVASPFQAFAVEDDGLHHDLAEVVERVDASGTSDISDSFGGDKESFIDAIADEGAEDPQSRDGIARDEALLEFETATDLVGTVYDVKTIDSDTAPVITGQTAITVQRAVEENAAIVLDSSSDIEKKSESESVSKVTHTESLASQSLVSNKDQLAIQGTMSAASPAESDIIKKSKYATPLAAGIYMIATANSTTRVLDVADGAKGNGGNVLLWDWHNVAWQKWKVSFDTDGLYTITNVHSGRVLDVAGAAVGSGRNVLQWQYKSTGNANQQWILEKSGMGFILKSALNQRYVLDCTGNSAANGTNVEIWTANKGNNQTFNFINLAPSVQYERVIDDGIYVIAASKKQNQRVEVQGYSPMNAANVDLYSANTGMNQRWSFQHRSDGLYNVVNLGSGLALDVSGASLTAGSNVLQYQLNGGKNQLWGVVKNADGTYTLYSALNGLALDIQGASIANLANVETYYPNGAHNQKFVLTKQVENYSGTHAIYSRLSQDLKAIDVPNFSYANGAQLALWTNNDGLNQRYLLEKVGSAYTIRPVSSGKYLTVSGGMIVQTSAQGEAGTASSNQLWDVGFTRDGFQIKNVGTNTVMSVMGSKAANSAKMQAAKWNGVAAQKFLIRPSEMLPRGLYTFTNVANINLSLDASGASFNNGTNAIVWKSSNMNNQKFALASMGGGYYRVTLALGGTVLGSSGGDGASVKLYNWTGADSQLWKPVLIDGGFTLQNKASGMQLVAASKNSGSDVVQRKAANDNLQRWRIAKCSVNLSDMSSFVNCLNLASGSSSLSASRACVDFSTSSSQWKALQNALASCWNAGIDVGFLSVDCNTGMTLSINADKGYYGASTIKGLYITYLCEEYLEKGYISLGSVEGLMHDAIVYSDNYDYMYLRNSYGSQSGFNAWLAQVGVGGIGMWGTYSPRTLAKAWVHMLEYENSGGRYVGFWRSIFNHSDYSSIYGALGGYRTVYSKPGWMGGGTYGYILDDGGIVKNGERSYVLAVMTTAYPYDWHKGRVESLVRAIDGVHATIGVGR